MNATERKPFDRHEWFEASNHNYTLSHGIEHIPKYGGFKIPAFQRALVWTVDQKVKLIESLWAGLPIGSYVMNQDGEPPYTYDNMLLDGQQRWDAIISYTKDQFPVHDYLWSELPVPEQLRFMHKGFDCQVTQFRDPAILQEIFERLAYGGTPNVRPEEQ